MPSPGEPSLSLSEWLVLCLITEQTTHGNAIAAQLGPDGPLGQVWHVHKAVVYRSIDRLQQAGLVVAVGEEPSSRGPVRTMVEATPQGRATARGWLARPVAHTRDIRSELLVKLALLDRAGTSPAALLQAQHAQLQPIADALAGRLAAADGFERILLLWRYETISATIRFLDALSVIQP
jgi:DNA-binding PadR family transcriptional regulator